MKRKSLIVLGLIAVMSVGAVGCGGKTAEAIEDTGSSTVVSEIESESKDTEVAKEEIVISEVQDLEELEKYRREGETDEDLVGSNIKINGVEMTPDEYNEYCLKTYGMTAAQRTLDIRRRASEAAGNNIEDTKASTDKAEAEEPTTDETAKTADKSEDTKTKVEKTPPVEFANAILVTVDDMPEDKYVDIYYDSLNFAWVAFDDGSVYKVMSEDAVYLLPDMHDLTIVREFYED